MFWWVVDGFDGMNMEWFWSFGWLPHRTNDMFVGVYKPYLLTKKQHHKDSNSTISCLNKLRQHFGAPHCGTCSVQVLYFLWSTPCHNHPDKQRVSKGNGQFPSIRRRSTNVGCSIAIVLYFTGGISTESGDSKHCCPATWSGLNPQDELEVPTLMPRSKYMGLMGYCHNTMNEIPRLIATWHVMI